MKEIFFRVDTNDVVATGHIMRCLSIADAAVDALLSDFDNPLHMAVLPNFNGGAQALMSLDF